jgi:hypothetical protein
MVVEHVGQRGAEDACPDPGSLGFFVPLVGIREGRFNPSSGAVRPPGISSEASIAKVLGITVLTSETDLRAAGPGIVGVRGPFYMRVFRVILWVVPGQPLDRDRPGGFSGLQVLIIHVRIERGFSGPCLPRHEGFQLIDAAMGLREALVQIIDEVPNGVRAFSLMATKLVVLRFGGLYGYGDFHLNKKPPQ